MSLGTGFPRVEAVGAVAGALSQAQGCNGAGANEALAAGIPKGSRM